MKFTNLTTILRFTLLAILLILLTACKVSTPIIKTTQATPIPFEADYGSLSDDSVATLESLEKIDDYPFYVMHYYGDYEYPRTSSTMPGGSEFACSLFAR